MSGETTRQEIEKLYFELRAPLEAFSSQKEPTIQDIADRLQEILYGFDVDRTTHALHQVSAGEVIFEDE